MTQLNLSISLTQLSFPIPPNNKFLIIRNKQIKVLGAFSKSNVPGDNESGTQKCVTTFFRVKNKGEQ